MRVKGVFRFLLVAGGIGLLSFVGGVFLFDLAMRMVVGKGDIVTVPEVTGMMEGEANRLLEESGLYLVVERETYDAGSDSGSVLMQRPTASERVKRGRRIHVVVSRGRERVTVPQVSGQRVRQARIALSRVGLKTESIFGVPHDQVERDLVIATDPVAGTPVTAGEPVQLLVSLGPEPSAFLMPDLRRKRESDVRRHLNLFGLSIARVTYRAAEEEVPGVVLGQNPRPGAQVDGRTSIEVEVSTP